jgi:DNA-binding NtrC family response regulator
MGTEPRRSLRRPCEASDPQGAERASSTRIRVQRTSKLPRESCSERSPAAALLAPWGRELRALARRLALGGGRAFTASWLAECRNSTLLAGENGEYTQPIDRAGGPLLDSLAKGLLDVAELHVVELFNDLRMLALDVASVLDVIAAFERAVVPATPSTEREPLVQALGRFLTCSAIASFSGTTAAVPLTESSERLRERPRVKISGLSRLVGESVTMRALRAQLEDVASAPGSVLIVGESGTGKELVAEAIHQLGPFAAHPFVPVNCAALPRELIESELFGHERGAFTGSRESAPGLLRGAGGGTVFLDEITEMPEVLQPKLLRALEQRAVRPVGGLRELPISARIVAATNADPERNAELTGLRADLFYRLCVHRVEVPPLRERVEDIPLLVAHFLREVERRGHRAPSAFSGESLAVLAAHRWAGNVRELRNVVEHSCATAKGGRVDPCHLPQRIVQATAAVCAEPTAGTPAVPDGETLQLRSVERRHIAQILTLAGGNKARAARLLGLSRHQLYLKLERLALCDAE